VVFEYFLVRRPTIYLSAPLSSGIQFLNWYSKVGQNLKDNPAAYQAAHSAEVLTANKDRARAVADELRGREPGTEVIDPTAFAFPGWTQDDYRCFWGQIISRHAGRVFFLDGWESSIGCVHEFRIATINGLPTLNPAGEQIDIRSALEKMAQAALTMEHLGLNGGFLREVQRELLGSLANSDGVKQ
jgi:hypothetical protein